MSDEPTVTLTMKMVGYESSVSFPVTHAQEALIQWLQMQIDQMARWKPGIEVTAKERRSLIPAGEKPYAPPRYINQPGTSAPEFE